MRDVEQQPPVPPHSHSCELPLNRPVNSLLTTLCRPITPAMDGGETEEQRLAREKMEDAAAKRQKAKEEEDRKKEGGGGRGQKEGGSF